MVGSEMDDIAKALTIVDNNLYITGYTFETIDGNFCYDETDVF